MLVEPAPPMGGEEGEDEYYEFDEADMETEMEGSFFYINDN